MKFRRGQYACGRKRRRGGTYELPPGALDDRDEDLVEEDAKTLVALARRVVLTRHRGVHVDPPLDHADLSLERRLRALRPIPHLVRETQDSATSRVDEGHKSVEHLVASVLGETESRLGLLRRTKELLGDVRAHRRDRASRVAALSVLVLRDDTGDGVTALLVFVDVLGDHEHVRVGALKERTVGMVLRSHAENLVEEERVLEAALDGLDEE